MDTRNLITIVNISQDDATSSKDEDGKGKEIILEGKGKEKITSSDDIYLEEKIVIPN